MRSHLFLFLSFVTSPAFADEFTIIKDGKTYICQEGGAGCTSKLTTFTRSCYCVISFDGAEVAKKFLASDTCENIKKSNGEGYAAHAKACRTEMLNREACK